MDNSTSDLEVGAFYSTIENIYGSDELKIIASILATHNLISNITLGYERPADIDEFRMEQERKKILTDIHCSIHDFDTSDYGTQKIR